MKTKELRLGDIVTDESGFMMFITAIFKDSVYMDFEGNESDVWEIDEKDLRPIPLTEKILLKCGFKKEHNLDDTSEFIIDDFSVQRESYKNEKGKFSNQFRIWVQHLNENGWRKPLSLELKYVHQLQNIYFDLTGKELEISINDLK
ncbi:hypothetical protein [uncultured Bacteroides sp.]|uniref:hypothetical protein n=1 Tax=uncultured Bacteroides sp. TaxID=162156 RepID=UPI002AAC4697|nr:hypothetical protein [uncultured Bacteroides sp.]